MGLDATDLPGLIYVIISFDIACQDEGVTCLLKHGFLMPREIYNSGRLIEYGGSVSYPFMSVVE